MTLIVIYGHLELCPLNFFKANYHMELIQEDYFFLKRDIVENLPPKPPEKASPEFQSFIMKCLTKDYKVRHTAEELLNDPFIAFVNEKDSDQIIINIFKKIEIGLPTF